MVRVSASGAVDLGLLLSRVSEILMLSGSEVHWFSGRSAICSILVDIVAKC